MQRRWQILRSLAVQALVILLLTELGLRLLAPHYEKLRQLLYMPAATADFSRFRTLEALLAPTMLGWSPYRTLDGFVTNSRGLRTPDYTAPKPAGRYRVAVVGDSFVFSSGGVPYSLGMPHLLEEGLRRRTRQKVDVFALGVPGVGPLFERRLWQLEGARVEADVVVLAFFVGNDFTDELELPGEDLKTTLARHSYLLRWVRNYHRLTRSDPTPLAPEPPVEPPPPGQRGGFERERYLDGWEARLPRIAPDVLRDLEAQRSWICDRRQQGRFVALAEQIEEVLRGFRAEVEATGAILTVLVIPDRFQVHPEERREILAHLRREDADFDWELPQRRLGEFFEREGMHHLDLLPASRQATAAGEVLYQQGETHWNAAGNALAARALGEHVWREIAPLLAARNRR